MSPSGSGSHDAETAPNLSVVVLLSAEADRTASFYRDLLGVPLKAERHDGRHTHYACRLGTVYFTVQPAADLSEVPERGHDSMQLCFTTPDLEGRLASLAAHGVSPLHPPRPFEHTVYVTLLDPDRRHVRLMTPWSRPEDTPSHD